MERFTREELMGLCGRARALAEVEGTNPCWVSAYSDLANAVDCLDAMESRIGTPITSEKERAIEFKVRNRAEDPSDALADEQVSAEYWRYAIDGPNASGKHREVHALVYRKEMAEAITGLLRSAARVPRGACV